MPRGRPKKNKEVEKLPDININLEKEVIRQAEKEAIREVEPVKSIETPEQKEKTDKLNGILKDLDKQLGKGSIKFANTIEERKRISFGNRYLDKLTGGGVPEGTFTTIWGSKSCSKTTIVLGLIASAQKQGKQCVYVNGERSYDPIWAEKQGVDTNKLVVIDVEMLEQGLDVVIKLCREKVADLIVFDSLHGIAPKGELYEGKAEKEKSVEADTMALRARKLTQFFEMSTAYVAEAKCAIVFIGQSRMDLGGFIKLETLTGGHALMHFSRLILKVRRGQGADAPTEKRETEEVDENGKKKKETVVLGFDLVVHVDKSQISNCRERNEIHVPFYFGEGLFNEDLGE